MIRSVGVVIPAANEQDLIGACLEAMAVAQGELRRVSTHEVDVEVVVVLDSCIDGTAAAVARYPDIRSVDCALGRVGAARALGARWLLTRRSAPLNEMWLANTDADSVVRPDWLARMVQEADCGADLVLGTVVPGPGLVHPARQRWLRQHQLRDNHPHVHGANFGIRADAYSALGGWPQLATAEDVVLARRATSSTHLRILRTASIPVQTSTRLIGRAPRGFSSYLRAIS